ncbi:MAG: SMC-Scp complex subunit ScpB, partial [Armatimonadetes bacterium]|nr:SMC-Scp complex subunit ScpB [Armatimonadota bacterium]
MPEHDEHLGPDQIEDLARAAECLLFASTDPLPRGRLAELLDCQADALDAILEALEQRLLSSGLQMVRLAGGYALATRPEYAPYITRLREPPKERLSSAALEVLAIVSYRQPITRAEIEAVRGVDSSGSLRTLIEKGLVTVVGRKPAPGRPMLFGT